MAMKFENATVIGTGMMGPGIAAILSLAGVKTTIVSRTAEGADKGLQDAVARVETLRTAAIASDEAAASAHQILSGTRDLDAAVRDADIVIESAPEKMEFKQELFAHMDSVAKSECVLASNTSGLSITKIAERCTHPERVITTHFWNPPHLMPLVEIVRGEKTSDEVTDSVRRLLLATGKIPVVVKKDKPGQLGNRLQMALLREAIHIVAEGIADAADVDLAAKLGFGLRLPVYGILEHQDIVGLDLGMSVLDYVSRDLDNTAGTPEYAQELMSRGELGARSGKGFHDWSERSAVEVKRLRDEFVLHMVRSGFVQRATGKAAGAGSE